MNEPVDLVTFKNHKAVRGTAEQLSWDALAERLHTCVETPCDPCPRYREDGKTPHRCDHKHGPAWSPVVLDGPRANVNVRHVSALVLDLDHVRAGDVRPFLATLAPYRHIVHSTHSHRPPADVALRAVVALSRPVPAGDWRRFYAAATRHLGVPPGLDARDDPARLFFLPSAPPSRIGRFFRSAGEGAALDVDALLAVAPAAVGPVMVTPPAGEAGKPSEKNLSVEDFTKALRDLRRRYRAAGNTRRLGLVEAALDGTELVPAGAGQDPALNELMGILAFKLPPGTAAECVVTLVDRSIVAMGAGPEGLDHWRRKAAQMYERAAARRMAADAANAAVLATLAPRLKEALARAEAAKGGGEPAPEEPGEEPDAPADWVDRLILMPNANAPTLRACEHNATTILRYSPEWFGVIRFNAVTKTVEVGAGHPLGDDVRLDGLARAIGDHLQARWGLFIGESQVYSCISSVAALNEYDPLAEYLDGLAWDGVPRLDTFLERAASARTVSEAGQDITGHVRRISRRWLISAAARALRPGVKADTVLILEGEQGIGKSSLLQLLAGDFYADAPLNLEDKDTKILAAQSWVMEVPELASFRRSQADALKAFFSGSVDKIRPPYGRTHVEFKRRCVFAATVNPEESGYLTDPTGNRRYWPVRVGQVDLAWVRATRDQLWAEAAHYARQALVVIDRDGAHAVPAHLRWWLDRDEEGEAAAEAVARVHHSPLVEIIREWVLAMPPEKRPASVETHAVARDALQAPAERVTRALEMEIGRALKTLGFTKRAVRRGSLTGRAYFTPDELLREAHAPKARPGTLALVAGGKP
jgi:hypothetical protein